MSSTHNERSANMVNNKRKRETPASRAAANKRTTTAFSRRSPPREVRPAEPEDDDDRDRTPPRKLKRPGARATVNKDTTERLERQKAEQQQLEEQAWRNKSGAEAVAQHYNAVPERGREWRSSESKIKGLRSLNNWIKSTLIQKFSRPEFPVEHLAVLDMACGKGGDLGKWEKAPQPPSLYVGCDIANVSIDQARDRYAQNMRRGGRNRRGPAMQAEFYVQDTFGRSLAGIDIIRRVGFNPNAGPGNGVIQGGMPMSGGFDVVSMMFALHYSYENETLARGMLANVAGALKKGGRFIGVMPNSDVIAEKLREVLAKEAPGKTPNDNATPANGATNGKADDGEDDDWDPEKPTEPAPAPTNGNADDDEDDWDPEKPTEPQPTITTNDDEKEEDDWDPEKPSGPTPSTTSPLTGAPANPTPAQNPSTPLPEVKWGNDIYSVRVPHPSSSDPQPAPLPRDGIFRPPYGWKYHYSLEEAVDAPEFVVPFEAFRALAEDYGLELLYRKGFREVYEDESEDRELGLLAERMGVRGRDRSAERRGCLVSEVEMEAAAFYHAFCFYKT